MQSKPYKITAPIMIDVRPDGARQVSARAVASPDEECLIVVYHHPTVAQARQQFWISCKMLAAALARGLRSYFRRIDRGHNAVYRTYPGGSGQNDRSSTHGLS